MTDSPKNSFNESVSALVDGEAAEIDVRRVLKRSASDDSVRETWRRYHAVSAVIRGERVATGVDISAGVMQALENEPAHSISHSSRARRWLEGMSKAGIAAAVAAVVVVGVQQMPAEQQGMPGDSEIVSAEPAQQPAATAPDWFRNEALSARTVSAAGEPNPSRSTGLSALPDTASSLNDPEVQAYINRVLEKHAQKAAAENGLKVVPLSRASSSQED